VANSWRNRSTAIWVDLCLNAAWTRPAGVVPEPELGQDRHFLARDRAQRLAEIDVRTVDVGEVEERDALVVVVAEQRVSFSKPIRVWLDCRLRLASRCLAIRERVIPVWPSAPGEAPWDWGRSALAPRCIDTRNRPPGR